MILIDKKVNFQILDNLRDLKIKWIKVFGAKQTEKEIIDEIDLEGYLWEEFNCDRNDYLEGNEARKGFDQLKKRGYYVFYDNYRYDFPDLAEYQNKAFEVLDWNKAKAKDFNKEDDIYIVDKYFRWTYVNTHEQGWCGPYFCTSSK